LVAGPLAKAARRSEINRWTTTIGRLKKNSNRKKKLKI